MSLIPARLSVVAMGVQDVAETAAYFRGLGWPVSRLSNEHVTWFRTADTTIAVYRLADLAAEAQAPTDRPLVTFATDLPSARAVTDAVRAAQQAGAELVHEPRREAWGGTAGYVRIPGGHVWEFTHNPEVGFAPDGRTLFP